MQKVPTNIPTVLPIHRLPPPILPTLFWSVSMETVVLGGTHQKDDFNTKPCPFDAKFIHSGCVAKVAALKNCKVREEWVGLRPGRKTVRLERDQLVTGSYKSKVSAILFFFFFLGGLVVTFFEIEFETKSLTQCAFSRLVLFLGRWGVGVCGSWRNPMVFRKRKSFKNYSQLWTWRRWRYIGMGLCDGCTRYCGADGSRRDGAQRTERAAAW